MRSSADRSAIRGLGLAVALALILGACQSSSSGSSRSATASSSGFSTQSLSDLTYATKSSAEQLDLRLPTRAQARPVPVVIWFHGGGWRVGDKSQIADSYDPAVVPPKPTRCDQVVQVQVPDAAALQASGYAVASVNYRLTQDPIAAVQDAKAAVRYLRANAARYHLDPQRFAAWGDSAGGYTVIMLGVTGSRHTLFDDPALGNPNVSSTVQAVVDWFGPTDSSQIPGQLGSEASPFTYITAGSALPPFKIANGDADCVVPAASSRRLYTALTSVGSVATLTILPGARHEDPAFMRTQLKPTLAFLNQTFGQ